MAVNVKTPEQLASYGPRVRLGLNLFNGLVVNRPVITRNLARTLPFAATENLLMAAVARGGDRQELHERIRQHSQAVTAELKAGAERNSLLDRLRADPAFAGVDIASVSDPARFVGRAPEQVDEFLADVVEPIRTRYPELLGQAAQVSV